MDFFAEAAARGCALIGYSGLGGREIFELAKKQNIGWEVEFGDWQGFINGTKMLVNEFYDKPNELSRKLQSLSDDVRNIYSWKRMNTGIRNSLEAWERQLDE